ncbi:MAG TPA: NAD(P)H-dependent oxidoreductase [Segetibacter sp.]|jgi:NAD(P)H-dependent FMN reductase
MKIEIIAGSPRMESVTKRVALHLFDRIRETEDIEVGLIDVQNHILPPVET